MDQTVQHLTRMMDRTDEAYREAILLPPKDASNVDAATNLTRVKQFLRQHFSDLQGQAYNEVKGPMGQKKCKGTKVKFICSSDRDVFLQRVEGKRAEMGQMPLTGVWKRATTRLQAHRGWVMRRAYELIAADPRCKNKQEPEIKWMVGQGVRHIEWGTEVVFRQAPGEWDGAFVGTFADLTLH